MHIQELILETASLPNTRLFYHKTLELDIIEESPEAISFKSGKTKLTFRKAQSGKPYYHFAFNIVNNKFSDSFEWINNKLDILPAHDDMLIAAYDDWNAQSFYFYDNNGSIVEFIARFDLPYYSAEPFSSACITEISEAGFVVDDVETTAESLHNKYQLPYFSKGPKLHDFIAMGDDYGLILLSQNKRGWMPTHKPGLPFAMTVVGDDGTKINASDL